MEWLIDSGHHPPIREQPTQEPADEREEENHRVERNIRKKVSGIQTQSIKYQGSFTLFFISYNPTAPPIAPHAIIETIRVLMAKRGNELA
jgi:hypothetical protein